MTHSVFKIQSQEIDATFDHDFMRLHNAITMGSQDTLDICARLIRHYPDKRNSILDHAALDILNIILSQSLNNMDRGVKRLINLHKTAESKNVFLTNIRSRILPKITEYAPWNTILFFETLHESYPQQKYQYPLFEMICDVLPMMMDKHPRAALLLFEDLTSSWTDKAFREPLLDVCFNHAETMMVHDKIANTIAGIALDFAADETKKYDHPTWPTPDTLGFAVYKTEYDYGPKLAFAVSATPVSDTSSAPAIILWDRSKRQETVIADGFHGSLKAFNAFQTTSEKPVNVETVNALSFRFTDLIKMRQDSADRKRESYEEKIDTTRHYDGAWINRFY